MAAGSGRSTRGCPRRSFCCRTVTQGCACSLRALALCDGHSTVQRYLGRGHRRRRLLAPCHAVLRLELQRLHGGLELRLGLSERLGADLIHRHLCGGPCAVCQRKPASRGHRSRSHVAIALGTGGGVGGVQDLAVAGGEHGTALGTHAYGAVPGKDSSTARYMRVRRVAMHRPHHCARHHVLEGWVVLQRHVSLVGTTRHQW